MPKKKIEIEVLVDSLATISDIVYKEYQGKVCENCRVGGPIFMDALNKLRKAGKIQKAPSRASAKKDT